MKVVAAIPAYNVASTLPRVIASVQSQKPAPDETLVIDDGSTDGSADVARAAGARVIRFERNFGRGAARARVFEETDAEFIMMCDATSEIPSHFLAQGLSWFEAPNVAAVFGHYRQSPSARVADRWRGRHLFRPPPACPRHRALLATNACVLRSNLVRAAGGFDPRLRANEDSDLGARFLDCGFDVICDPALYNIAITTNTILQVLERYVRWNTQRRMTWKEYLRHILYSIRVMARADMRARDPAAVLISLAAPHCQFWWSRDMLKSFVK